MEEGTARTRLQDEPEDRFVRLRAELGVTSLGMNQIVLRPGQRGRIHRHERQEEVYLVLDGTLTLLLEGDETTLERGELIRVAPGIRRQLVNRGPGALHLLALGGAGEHEGRDGVAYRGWDATEGVSPQEMALPEDLPESERRA
jgi:quercetin dioxygenase-like cupin family protein